MCVVVLKAIKSFGFIQWLQRNGLYALVLDEDDVQLFEYLNPNRNTLTGSDAKAPAVEDYNPKSKLMNLVYLI